MIVWKGSPVGLPFLCLFGRPTTDDGQPTTVAHAGADLYPTDVKRWRKEAVYNSFQSNDELHRSE